MQPVSERGSGQVRNGARSASERGERKPNEMTLHAPLLVVLVPPAPASTPILVFAVICDPHQRLVVKIAPYCKEKCKRKNFLAGTEDEQPVDVVEGEPVAERVGGGV